MVITAITNTAAATAPPTTPPTPDSAETTTLGNTTKTLLRPFPYNVPGDPFYRICINIIHCILMYQILLVQQLMMSVLS